MAKNYNVAHFIFIFKIGNIVTMAILAKEQAINDTPRIEARIINIPYENRHILQTEYSILTNLYLTFKLNQISAELVNPL